MSLLVRFDNRLCETKARKHKINIVVIPYQNTKPDTPAARNEGNRIVGFWLEFPRIVTMYARLLQMFLCTESSLCENVSETI